MSEINYLSATKIIAGIKDRKFSAVEVAKAHLKRIAEVNPSLNAIIQQVSPEDVLLQASLADENVNAKKPLGKLHGLPITIKDSFNVKGMTCSAGSIGLAKTASEDATAVARLRAEGAIILGLTNVPEFLLAAESDNLLYGKSNNPHNLNYTCGGSSGGEAAIISAGGSALGLGSDAGGSIRIPAHYCGIVGFKPTRGLVPMTGSVLGNSPGIFGSVVANGPLARCVDDLFLGLSIIAGPDGLDYRVPPVTLKDPLDVDLKHLRIAYYFNDGISCPTEETLDTIGETLKAIRPHVKSIEEKLPPAINQTMKLVWETIFLGGDEGAGLMGYLQFIGVDKPSSLVQTFLSIAKKSKISTTELRMRLMEIDQFHYDMLTFFTNYDVIICPVSATPAKLHGTAFEAIADFSYTMSYNLLGAPALSIPFGISKEGFSIGVQIIASPWRDEIALAVGRKLESLRQ
ncbi:MAG: amidase [Parachlamydiaceae bacterium]|nr:amidase [Parachlamydiaceae bacterium]